MQNLFPTKRLCAHRKRFAGFFGRRRRAGFGIRLKGGIRASSLPPSLPSFLPSFLPSYGTLSTPLGRIFPHHRQASKSFHEVGCEIYTQSRPDFPRINVVLLIFMDHDQAGKLKVREFAFVFPIALPKPGRVEEEINKISRTFTYHFQSMIIARHFLKGSARVSHTQNKDDKYLS